jgi:ketosteroid isomerase-like protein
MGIAPDTVRRIFSHLESGLGDEFFEHVADDVDWTVEGTHPLAGRYRSKEDFHSHTFARLNRILPGGTQLHVQSVLTDGDWAVVELRSHATGSNGMRFDNRYCWVVEVRAYLDSALVQRLIDENEG